MDTVESIEWPSVIPGRRVRLLTRQDSRGRLVALEQQGFAPRVSLAASGQPQVEAEPIRRDLHDPVLLTGALGISPVQVRPGNHRLWRDDFGRAVAQWSPDSGLVRRQFDQADRLVEEWRADGSHAQHHYDASGRLISTRVKPAGQDFDRVQADAQKVTLQWQGFEVTSIQGPGQHDFFER
ncbi:MAG: hypothetical protein VW339_07685, partial [Quisquiliibacterium sp.]